MGCPLWIRRYSLGAPLSAFYDDAVAKSICGAYLLFIAKPSKFIPKALFKDFGFQYSVFLNHFQFDILGNRNLKEKIMNIEQFWKAVLAQDEREIRKYFHAEAYVNWHCTNEHFTVDEYIVANCEYPGEWDGLVERVEIVNDLIITVVRIYPKDRSISFHVTSFIQTKNDKITAMDEYYADDGMAPQWRLDKRIGTPIK